MGRANVRPMKISRSRRNGSSLALALLFGLQLGGAASAEPGPVATGVSAAPRFSNADLAPPSSEREAAPMLEWSAKPGVFEADLRRRYGNPLYLESRREFGEEELLEARRRDADLMWGVLENYIELVSDKNRMARFELASQMGDALLRIDEGTWKALRAGGEAYALAASIQELRSRLLAEWKVAAARDPGVKALLDAERRIPSVKTGAEAIRFLALIQSAGADEDGPIRRYEFGAALLSEEPDTIRSVYKSLRGELKSTVREQLTRVLQEIGREEVDFERKREKVALVAGLLGRTPGDFGIRSERSSN